MIEHAMKSTVSNDQWLNTHNKSPPNFLTFILFGAMRFMVFAKTELTINARRTFFVAKDYIK